MARAFSRKFYDSQAWHHTQKAVMRRESFICQRCGRPAAVVHHKIPLTPQNIGNPDISLNPDNLEALCADCHAQIHQRNRETCRNGLAFDKSGNLVQEVGKQEPNSK